MAMNKGKWAFVVLALLVSGCASDKGDFPSLSKRPYETDDPLGEVAEAPAPPVATTLPADLQQKLDALLARGRAASAAYEAAIPDAHIAARGASGSAVGSETWVNAHMILSRADGARADGVAALGELDKLIAQQTADGADAGIISLLSKPEEILAKQIDAQNDEVERIAAMIGV